MKTILFAPYDFTAVGGVERYVLSFSKAAVELGHQMVLCTDSRFQEAPPCPVVSTDSIGGDSFDLALSHAIYGRFPPVNAKVHVHTFHGTILGNLKVRPWLWAHPRFWRWLWMEWRSLAGKSGVVTVSQSAVQEVREMGFKGPIRLVGSGGGFEVQRKTAKPPSSVKGLRCLFCGRQWDKVKRFHWIRQGIELARKQNPQIELLVAGGKGLSTPGITFMGNLPWSQVQELIRSCHVQINASFYEGCSLSLAEGMFLGGLATLATPTGGNLFQVRPGENGYFFKSPAELAGLLVRLATDAAFFSAVYGSDRSPWIPSWEDVVRQVMDFGRDLISGSTVQRDG